MAEKPDHETGPPSAILGAVTKKQNEITELLPNLPQNVDRVKLLYHEFLGKVEVLKQACGTTHLEWLEARIQAIETFRAKIDAKICGFSQPRSFKAIPLKFVL